MKILCSIVIGVIVAYLAPSISARADPIADFYTGKTIRIINWSAPGGEYDLHGRLFAQFLGRHIPGSPTVIQQAMPGAGGLLAANYLYNSAARDGTVLAIMNNGSPLFQTFDADNARYDAGKLNWIGTIAPITEDLVAWHTAPVKSFADLLTTELIIGTTGKGNTSYMIPVTMNALLGTKIKSLIGFRGGADVNLAIERGEIMGRINAWSGMKATKPDWIKENEVNVLVQSGLAAAPDLPNVPLLVDLAHNDDDRATFRIFAATAGLGRPLVTTPDVPPDRLGALQAAFAAMMTDQAFIAEATKLQIEIAPVGPGEMRKLVEGILSTPKPIIARLKTIVE